MHRVSVIIATMNRPAELARCLRSVAHQTLPPHEVVIIDDGAMEAGPLAELLPEGVRFRYRRKSPPGLSASRNLGARIADGDLLLFLDDDVVLEADYIRQIVQVFEQDAEKRVAGVSGIILNRNPKPGLFRHWARFFLMDRGRQGEVLPWGFYTRVLRPDRVIDVDWIPGGLSCFRKSVFEQYQLADLGQAGRHGLADVEFGWRLSRRFRLKTTPFAGLYHYPSPRARERARQTGYKQVRNHIQLFEQYGRKTLKNRACFLWALTGLILGNAGSALFTRTARDRKNRVALTIGNLEGLFAYLTKRRRRAGQTRIPRNEREP